MKEPREVIIKYVCINDDATIRSTRCTISEATDLINLINAAHTVYIEGAGKDYDGEYVVEWITFVPTIDEYHLDVVNIMLEPQDL